MHSIKALVTNFITDTLKLQKYQFFYKGKLALNIAQFVLDLYLGTLQHMITSQQSPYTPRPLQQIFTYSNNHAYKYFSP